MCEEEKYTLQILLTETLTQSQLFKDKRSPYLVSLEKGVQKAQERLQNCEYNQCMSQFYDLKTDTREIQKINVSLAKEKIEQFKKCLSLF